MTDNIKFFLLAGLAILFALFIWPTYWRYEHVGQYLVRINSLTGKIELMDLSQGWTAIAATPVNELTPIAEAPAAAPPAAPAPPSDAEIELLMHQNRRR